MANILKVVRNESYVVIVDYDQPVGNLVFCGRYDNHYNFGTSEGFSKYFPVSAESSGKKSIEVHLVVFAGRSSTAADDASKELDSMGLRPCDLHTLLSFGVQYPKRQKRYPYNIFCLGTEKATPKKRFRRVVYLRGHRSFLVKFLCGERREPAERTMHIMDRRYIGLSIGHVPFYAIGVLAVKK